MNKTPLTDTISSWLPPESPIRFDGNSLTTLIRCVRCDDPLSSDVRVRRGGEGRRGGGRSHWKSGTTSQFVFHFLIKGNYYLHY